MEHSQQFNGKISDLGFGHFGNGITVWDRSRERFKDYARVAHISADRQVKYRDLIDLPLSSEQKAHIEEIAKNWDPEISATQEQKVFNSRPN